MIKLYGLIFDVDGVIADTEAVNALASARVFADLFGIAGVKREDFQAGLGRGAAEYVKAAAKVHNLELSDQQIELATEMRQRYFLDILDKQPLPAFPGVLELINAASERSDFKLAIATSSTLEKSRAVLESANIPYKKMVYVTGSEIQNKKPDPQLFLTAAKKLEISPADCLVIEDAPDGVQSAKAAGAKCIAVTNSAPADQLTQADLICETREEINLRTITDLIDSR